MTDAVRIEHDSLGPVDVPAVRLWGAQTERARRHFPADAERMPMAVVRAMARVKRAAVHTLAHLGHLDPAVARAIVEAADEILAGRHDEEFPLPVWQSGSGTQSHMNVNEVLANRASELLGGPRGAARLVHPNDHVNIGQSTNDVFPTAMHLAALEVLEDRVVPSASALRDTLRRKAEVHGDTIKIGRTHLQDAVPMTVGQELSAYAAQVDHALEAIDAARPALCRLAIGGTAVGTGLNAPAGFATRVVARLADDTGWPLVPAPNPFAALAGHEPLVVAHAALRVLAVALTKIATDLRWLASGPRCGLGEIRLPENEPGSSIMPGKVNPTQLESLTMAAAQVMGNDVTMGVAAAGGELQLNVFKPLLIHVFLQSARLLADGCAHSTRFAIEGLEPETDRLAAFVERSLMLATALAPHIGYDQAAALARAALATGRTLREEAVASGLVSEDDFDRWTDVRRMVDPHA
ncbi:MAG: class II fumarate hydratase [Acidobacteria bacterium]|nr:class II fumarate hydratase [Acidobacteriota bacterium]